MKGEKKAGKRRRRFEREGESFEEREVFDGYDNFIVDDERLPSDYWTIREAREEYCKEYGYC